MDEPVKVLSWYAAFVHAKHRVKSGEDNWSDCEFWPCYQLQGAVLKGIPAAHAEVDGAARY